jgi:divalent metal cation (Fe/Co/Zn/Cd) transporter
VPSQDKEHRKTLTLRALWVGLAVTTLLVATLGTVGWIFGSLETSTPATAAAEARTR